MTPKSGRLPVPRFRRYSANASAEWMEDPFDSFGVDFSSIRRYIGSDPVQGSNSNVEYVNLMSSDVQPCLPGSLASNGIQGSRAPGQLLFIAGYPSSELINRLSQEHNINPEFWRRHLESILAASAPTFEDFKLPSATCGVFQLRFWTICSRPDGIGDEMASLESIRKDAETRMKEYKKCLTEGGELRSGDSIVRGYEVHDRKYFSIEQVVTIFLPEKRDDGRWTGE
ncbi:hypothetical protein KCU88_g4375, partial [Aureobasidium melanogenum]